MRVLLLQAAKHDRSVERTPPLGLLYLASWLRGRGHEVSLFDLRVFADCDVRRAEPAIRRADPQVVGISSHSPESPAMFELARTVKRWRPDVPVVVGGSYATNFPRSVLEACPEIDAVVVGEGEETFAELVESWRDRGTFRDVPGCWFRDGGGVRAAPPRPPIRDLDSLPFPAWDLADLPAYWRFPRIGVIAARREYMIVCTARGCPFRCAYCHHHMGRVWRPRGADNVVEELRRLARGHGVGEIVIVDDTFNLDRERVLAICDGIRRAGLRLALTFPTGIRGDLLDDRALEALAGAGTYRMMFSIETASERLQKMIRRDTDFPAMERAMRKAASLGMLLHGAIMLGLPTETEPEMRRTMRYVLDSPLHTVGVYRAAPYPGTDLAQIAREHGVRVPDVEPTLSLWEAGVNLSAEPLETVNRVSRLIYVRFYGDPRRLIALIVRLPNRLRMVPLLVGFFFRNLRRYRYTWRVESATARPEKSAVAGS